MTEFVQWLTDASMAVVQNIWRRISSPHLVDASAPDFNPIEMAFSKLKTALRKGAARTVTTLMKLIGKLIKTFAPEQCANYFRHAGYA
jgi:hypothetical protein